MSHKPPHGKLCLGNPMQWIAHLRSIGRALDTVARSPSHVLLILPSTRSALALAGEICRVRDCCVMAGPVSSHAAWRLAPFLRTPADIARAFAGQPELPRTVISFPDQLIGDDLSFAWIAFLGTPRSFSAIEALLVLRHRPRILALRTCSPMGDFGLIDVPYEDLLESQARRASLQALMSRLLAPLESELATPPSDWLAAHWLAYKSESQWRLRLREELKELECLLRLSLLSPACDRLRIGSAVAAVVARQKYVYGAVSP